MRLFVFKDLICIWRSCLEYESIWQDNGHRVNRVIGIFDHAATHAAGVIREYAPHHTCVNRGRVGPDPTTERFEHIIDKPADDAGLKANEFATTFHTVLSPMFGDVHQNSVRHGLAGETRP